MSMIRTAGQVLLAGIFITEGSQAFMTPGGRVQTVQKAGVAQNEEAAEQAVRFNAAVMVAGGTLLALDIAPKLAATALLGSLVPTTLVGHAFWKQETGEGRRMQRIQFMKNLGLLGGLLLVLAGKA